MPVKTLHNFNKRGGNIQVYVIHISTSRTLSKCIFPLPLIHFFEVSHNIQMNTFPQAVNIFLTGIKEKTEYRRIQKIHCVVMRILDDLAVV